MNNKELIILAIIAVIITAGVIISIDYLHVDTNDEKPMIIIEEGNTTYIKTIIYPDGNFRQFNNNSELIGTSFPNETIKIRR